MTKAGLSSQRYGSAVSDSVGACRVPTDQEHLTQKWDRRRTRHHRQVRDHLCQAAHTVVDKAGTIACEDLSAHMKSAQVPPPGHQPPTERLGQGRHGGHLHFDISAQRFCVGIGQSGLHIASRLPHRPVAGPSSLGPVLLSRRDCAGRGCQCRLQHSGEAVRRGDYVVHALQGRASALLAERTRTVVGTAPPGLELRGRATEPPSTESELPAPVPECTR